MSQVGVPAALYRGGTSKALIVRAEDLPSDPAQRDEWILAAFGSPDRRQIDGIGGAEILASKFAAVGPSQRDDADVDYTFAQVGIDEPSVDYGILCGNISSATGRSSVPTSAARRAAVRGGAPNALREVGGR
jgi:methylitaconate Delta-isomerase